MGTKRPDFRKKELALSASPYVYLPVERTPEQCFSLPMTNWRDGMMSE